MTNLEAKKKKKSVVFKRSGIQNMFIISIILLAKKAMCQSHKQRLPAAAIQNQGLPFTHTQMEENAEC